MSDDTPRPDGWAKRAVDGMSHEEVQAWIRRLDPDSLLLPENRDRRSPIERMIDEATGRDEEAER